MKILIITIFLIANITTIYAQTWQTLSPINNCTNRHENTLAAVGDKLILFGGRGIKPTDIYDIKENTWTKTPNTPLEFNHLQAGTYKGEVYVIGAFEGGYPHETPVKSIYIYNLEKQEWRKSNDIPTDRLRGSAGLVLYKNKFYVVCGIQDGHWDGHVAWLDEYDPETHTWKRLADAPHARDHVSAAIVNDKIYVAGGRRSSAKINKVFQLTEPAVDVYDFKTQTWTTLPESLNLPTPRAGNSAVALGNELIIMGGETGQKEAHSEVEALDTKKMTWRKLPNLNKGRHGTGAVVVRKKIYTVAGSGNAGGGPELNSIEVFE